MITTKMMKVDDEVDIQKIRWVALAFNWSLALLLFACRGISLIPSQIIRNATNISSAIVFWVMASIVLITTVGISTVSSRLVCEVKLPNVFYILISSY